MMRLPPLRRVVVVTLLAASALSCRSATRDDNGGPPPPPLGTWARVTASPDGTRLDGTFLADGHALEGARVEVLGVTPPREAVSSASGAWSVTVPAGAESYLRVTKPSFRTVQSAVAATLPPSTHLSLEMVPASLLVRIFDALHLTEDTAKGIVTVRFNMPARVQRANEHHAGFTASLSAGGGVPVVFGAHGPERSNATTGREEVVIVLNVAPGETTVTAQAPAGFTCRPTPGGSATTRVDPQVISFVSFDCQ